MKIFWKSSCSQVHLFWCLSTVFAISVPRLHILHLILNDCSDATSHVLLNFKLSDDTSACNTSLRNSMPGEVTVSELFFLSSFLQLQLMMSLSL